MKFFLSRQKNQNMPSGRIAVAYYILYRLFEVQGQAVYLSSNYHRLLLNYKAGARHYTFICFTLLILVRKRLEGLLPIMACTSLVSYHFGKVWQARLLHSFRPRTPSPCPTTNHPSPLQPIRSCAISLSLPVVTMHVKRQAYQ